MSDPVSLYWTHNGGAMQCDGVSVKLRTLPSIPGLPAHLSEVQFFCRRGEYRISADRAREMSLAECEAVLEFLCLWAAQARAALC